MMQVLVYKIPYRRARLAFRPSASREQMYLAYNAGSCFYLFTSSCYQSPASGTNLIIFMLRQRRVDFSPKNKNLSVLYK